MNETVTTKPRNQSGENSALALGGSRAARDPIWVYDNWTAYMDGILTPDSSRLTQDLAMQQLDELARLQRSGVHFDAYMMNAFWFDPDGGYREWRKPDWPDGPDTWIEGCRKLGLQAGLWFGCNSLWKINPAEKWQDSLEAAQDIDPGSLTFRSMSMFEGGFLTDFVDVLQHWYDRGIRLFELDMARFDVATECAVAQLDVSEIRRRNEEALRMALKSFRRANPDAMLVAFNDFGGDYKTTGGSFPFEKPVDLRWLEIFDTMYTGDLRVSDVPQANFWRSVDIYPDHMARMYERHGFPLERLESFVMLSNISWMGYSRRSQAWKGSMLLSVARGSWKQTIYGDLGTLSDEDGRWLSKVQALFDPLLALGQTRSFGAIPGAGEPYGFGSMNGQGAVFTVVNPDHQLRKIVLPQLSRVAPPPVGGRVLFCDAGFEPVLEGETATLGPGQMAAIGFGMFADSCWDLGVQDDVVVPRKSTPVDAAIETAAFNEIRAEIREPMIGDLRVVVEQRVGGVPFRSPEIDPDLTNDEKMDLRRLMADAIFAIEAVQGGQRLPIHRSHEGLRAFCGISWDCAVVSATSIKPNQPILVTIRSMEGRPVELVARFFDISTT